jgi:hypothetical protein
MRIQLKKLIVKLLIIFSISNIIINCDKCEDLMTDYLLKLNPSDFTNPIFATGSGFNDLGKYDLCKKNKNNKFVVIKILTRNLNIKDIETSIFMGFCLPNECLTENNFLKWKIKISKITNVSQEKIEFINSSEENAKYAVLDTTSIILLIIFSLYSIFASGLVKVLYDLIFIKKNFKKDYHHNHDHHHHNHQYLSNSNSKLKNDSDGYNSSSEENIGIKDKNYRESLLSTGSRNSHIKSSKSILEAINNNYNTTKQTFILGNNEKYNNLFRSSDINEMTTSSERSKSHHNHCSEIESKKKYWFYLFLENIFDVTKNFQKLFQSGESDDKEIQIFNGVRVITCFLLIFNQMGSLFSEFPVRNPQVTYDYFKSFYWQIFLNSNYTIDVFFALSGFFVAYSTLINLKEFKRTSWTKITLNIMFGLLRFWPAYTIIFIFYWKFYKFFFDSPLSGYIFNKELQSCDKQWPYILSLTNNFTYGLLISIRCFFDEFFKALNPTLKEFKCCFSFLLLNMTNENCLCKFRRTPTKSLHYRMYNFLCNSFRSSI